MHSPRFISSSAARIDAIGSRLDARSAICRSLRKLGHRSIAADIHASSRALRAIARNLEQARAAQASSLPQKKGCARV